MVKAREGLDAKDQIILEILEKDCRTAIAEIGKKVGLERTPCRKRIERLEKLGYICGYTIIRRKRIPIEPKYHFILIKFPIRPTPEFSLIKKMREDMFQYCNNNDEIGWAGIVQGGFDVLIRFDERQNKTLNVFLTELASLPFVGRTETISMLHRFGLRRDPDL